mgnify:FL=1
MTREEEESVEEFAERVRTVFATTLNLEKTEFTAADVAEFHKRLKATRAQPVTGKCLCVQLWVQFQHLGSWHLILKLKTCNGFT